MTKLKIEFAAELPVKKSLGDIACMTALLPCAGQRAIAFGWVRLSGSAPLSNEVYWVADVRREGVTQRMLPESLTERLVELTGRQQGTAGSYMWIHAFRLGEGFGLLLGTQEVHLFQTIHDEPTVIVIENGFFDLRAPEYVTWRGDRHYFPMHCGHSGGHTVPVVLSSPSDRAGQGRCASLLEIDTQAHRARWLLTGADGAPRGISFADYGPLLAKQGQTGALQFTEQEMTWDKPPLILDCAWMDNHWQLYIGGKSRAYHRFGLAPSVLSRNLPDLSLQGTVFEAREESFGRICASLDRMIVTPLRKNGPGKGKQTIYSFGDGEEHTLTLPRGYSKHSLVEYFDGCYWLLPIPWGYAHTPLVACTEA